MIQNHQARKIAVLFVSKETGNFFLRLHPNNEWGLLTGLSYGVRDDTIHFVTTQATRVGLTCSVNRIVVQGICQDHVLVFAEVCCDRFWSRGDSKLLSATEAAKIKNISPLVGEAVSLFQQSRQQPAQMAA